MKTQEVVVKVDFKKALEQIEEMNKMVCDLKKKYELLFGNIERIEDSIDKEILSIIKPTERYRSHFLSNKWIYRHIVFNNQVLKDNFKNMDSFGKRLAKLGFEREHIGNDRGWYIEMKPIPPVGRTTSY